MTQFKMNPDGLKIHLDYLKDELKNIHLLHTYLYEYMNYMRMHHNNFYFSDLEQLLNVLERLGENVKGRISFLEDLINAHYSLTDDISQETQEMQKILEMIEGDE